MHSLKSLFIRKKNTPPVVKQKEPEFVEVFLYDTPDGEAYASYIAAIISGNDMYGEVVLLKEKSGFLDAERNIPLNSPIRLSEWEWCPVPLNTEQLNIAEKLFSDYRKAP